MVASPPNKTIHTSFHTSKTPPPKKKRKNFGDGRIAVVAPNSLAMGFWRCCFSFLERLHHTDSPEIWHSCGLAFLELRSLKMGGIFIHANLGVSVLKLVCFCLGVEMFLGIPKFVTHPSKLPHFFPKTFQML